MNMSASTPHFAPLVVLLFLGTIFLLGTALLVLFCGAVRRSAFFAKLGAGAVATIASGYFLLLSGVSLASSEETLPPDGWKYFCEIDCHISCSTCRTTRAGCACSSAKMIRKHALSSATKTACGTRKSTLTWTPGRARLRQRSEAVASRANGGAPRETRSGNA